MQYILSLPNYAELMMDIHQFCQASSMQFFNKINVEKIGATEDKARMVIGY